MSYPKEAAKLPLVLIDRFSVAPVGSMVIVALGSQPFTDVPPAYHHQIIMSHANARWLADLINSKILEAEKAAQK